MTGVTMTPKERIEQIKAQRARIETPVSADDLEIARQLRLNIDALEKTIPKLEQAGFDTANTRQQLRDARERLDKLIRTFG